jgi:hypothetical protein
MHQSIRGALAMNPKFFRRYFRGVFLHDDGRVMTIKEARKALEAELALGHEIVPSAGCDNFDWKTGCKGHVKPDALTHG